MLANPRNPHKLTDQQFRECAERNSEIHIQVQLRNSAVSSQEGVKETLPYLCLELYTDIQIPSYQCEPVAFGLELGNEVLLGFHSTKP